uniref:Uncharacterized protein n=1 Tax=Arundo donax TaxID=35708 RepID=A0A0A9BM20_ARUDO
MLSRSSSFILFVIHSIIFRVLFFLCIRSTKIIEN